MKKIISILLICAMLLSFGVITASAEEAIVVEQGARMTAEQLNPSGDNQYDWTNNAISLTGRSVGSSSSYMYADATYTDKPGTTSVKIAHDGDYIYVRTEMNVIYATQYNRAMVVLFLDYDTQDTDNKIDYMIENNVYYDGYVDATEETYDYYIPGVNYQRERGYAGYAVAVNGGSALDNGVLMGRTAGLADKTHENYIGSGNTQTDVGGYIVNVFAIPIDEEYKDDIVAGSLEMNVGFMLINKMSGSGAYGAYTNVDGTYNAKNTGTSVQATYNQFVETVDSDDKLTTSVTLKGAETAPATTTNLAGVQEPATKGDTFDIRLVGTLNVSDDFANYKNVGFEITGANTLTSTTNSVYKTCLANDSTVPSWWYGGDYFYFTDITGVKLGTAYELTVKSFCTKADGTTVYGQEYKLTVDTAGNVALEAVN